MMDHGDYLTPYSDGSYPISETHCNLLVSMVSYKLFGISVLSSRLLFWLAGAMLVAITFFMAKSLTKPKNSLVAAFITAATPWFCCSARSIPDILLVLFLTVSAWGFLEI